MSETHVPVLFNEVMDQAENAAQELGGLKWALDATFGRGGHTRGLLERHPELKMIALDQDPSAIAFGREAFAAEIEAGRLQLVAANFESLALAHALCPGGFDFILFDLGVSSPQLDSPERGFSFYGQGPLDMRMDPSLKRTAADVIREASEEELIQLFRELGEVERPYKVVRAIVGDRKHKPFVDTLELAGLIERVDGWAKKGFHPATQYFMALRLFVNRELEVIAAALPEAVQCLRPGGWLAVITFHSLEDRIVKQFFRTAEGSSGESIRRKAFKPTFGEVEKNSRARSAKLRLFRRYIAGEAKSPKNKYAHLIGHSKGRSVDDQADDQADDQGDDQGDDE